MVWNIIERQSSSLVCRMLCLFMGFGNHFWKKIKDIKIWSLFINRRKTPSCPGFYSQLVWWDFCLGVIFSEIKEVLCYLSWALFSLTGMMMMMCALIKSKTWKKRLCPPLMQNLEEPLLWVSTQPWGRIPAKPGNSSHSKTLPEVWYTKDGQSSKCTGCICSKYYIYLKNNYYSGPAKENSRASQIGRDGIDRESAKLNKVWLWLHAVLCL